MRFDASISQSVVLQLLGVLETLSRSPRGQNYFYNNIKKSFALFTLILSRTIQWNFAVAGYMACAIITLNTEANKRIHLF